MILVREVFKTKPGKARELVSIFKKAIPLMQGVDASKVKIMTDLVSTYWTVVMEMEVESLEGFEKEVRSATVSDEVKEIMKDYISLLEGGHREIYLIE